MSNVIALPQVNQGNSSITESFKLPFFVSVLTGILPYSIPKFFKEKRFEFSKIASIWCILNMWHLAFHYHYSMTENFANNSLMVPKSSTLTTALGLLIVYMEPALMGIDVLAAVLNQKKFIEVFTRLKIVRDKLALEGIEFGYENVKKLGKVLIATVIFMEYLLITLNFIMFTTHYNAESFYYFLSGLPLLLNAIAKVWFVLLIFIIRQSLQKINGFLYESSRFIGDRNRKNFNNEINLDYSVAQNNFGHINKLGRPRPVQIVPAEKNNGKEMITMKNLNVDKDESNDNKDEFIVGDTMDKKLSNLCKIHDELCDIAKLVNQIFSFQMLVMMAYGFMSVTAQFYFMYCGLMGQSIPTQFRSANSICISVLFITYTACKCITITFICWKTKNNARQTGVYLHKLAHVVDESHFYTVVNHLSLKLLNHKLNFSACGFFNLDMTTIYAITGAITSYLIILIQFNLAAIRTKCHGYDSNCTAEGLGNNLTEDQN